MQSTGSRKALYIEAFKDTATSKPKARTEIDQRHPKRFVAQVGIIVQNRSATRLIGRRKGVADEILAMKEEERGRKRKSDTDDFMNGSRKRSMSASSYSSNSVSTISTNLSRSSSPKLAGLRHTGQSQVFSNLELDRKRRRSRSSSLSYTSESPPSRRRQERSRQVSCDGYDRIVPSERVSRRIKGLDRGQRVHTGSRSMSQDSHLSMDERRKPPHGETRRKRRRHSSRSPVDRGRNRDFNSKRGSRRTRSPSESRDRSEVIRNRKSMTPGLLARPDSRQDNRSRWPEHHPNADRRQSYSNDNDRYGSSARDRNEDTRGTRPPPKSTPQRKERSLSPFSKRLKLTQAMNMEH